MRLISTITDAASGTVLERITETVTINVTTYLTVLDLSTTWGVVGSAANDWGATPDLPFFKTDVDGVLVAYVNLIDGEIKFRENNAWDNNYGSDSSTGGALVSGGGNLTVTAGSYTNASLTVDAQGRLTAASSGTAPLTNITAGDGLVETGAATTPTISVDYAGAGNVIDAATGGTTIQTNDKIIYEDATDATVKEIAVSSLIALAPNTQETYTLPVAAGGGNSAVLNLTAGGSGSDIKSIVTINGTTNEVEISESTGNNGSVTVGFSKIISLKQSIKNIKNTLIDIDTNLSND